MRAVRCIVPGVVAAALAACAGADEPTYTVLIEHRAANLGRVAAREGRIVADMPRTNRYQEVRDLRLYPEPAERRRQKDGSTHLLYRFGYLPAGGTYAARMLVIVQPKMPVAVDLTRPGKGEPLDLGRMPAMHPYLQDHELCDVQSDAVRELAGQFGAAATTDGKLDRLAYARACYEFLTERIRYDRDDHFDPAPRVLRRGRGSCTELTFTFVALCRSQGIPARVVGGFVARSPTEPTIDSITHRWAEFHDARFGWVPVDPSRGGGWRALVGLRYFGHVNTPGVLFIQPGSGSSALSFRSSSIRYKGKADVRLRRTAYWDPKALSAAQLAALEQHFGRMRHHIPAVRRGVLRRLEGTRSTLECALLAEGLVDRSEANRLLAARLLATAKTPQAVYVLLRGLQVVIEKKRREQILTAVRDMVTQSSGTFREQVIWQLGRSRRPEAAEVLAGLIDRREAALRRQVGIGLVRCRRHKAAAEAIEKLLADEDDSVRLAVAVYLGYAKEPTGYAILLAFLEHKDFEARSRAIHALRHAAGKHLGYDPLARPGGNAAAITAWKAWVAGQIGEAQESPGPEEKVE